MSTSKRSSWKKKWAEKALHLFGKIGVFDAARRLSPNVLTILNYHRVDDASRPGFDTFAPNVTVTPGEFERQMDYVQRHYNVITVAHLRDWLRGEHSLPPHAALITFDDGYYDNYAHAYPILKARNLPAVIFLTTDYIGQDTPFYWDYTAYCFKHSRKTSGVLPLHGAAAWAGEGERKQVMKQWITRIKLLPDPEKQRAVADLAKALDVQVPQGAFSGLYLTWDQVREMSQNGIEMGAHTAGHPILTRIPLSQAQDELVRSRQRIELEIQKPVISFAYPNGNRMDFSSEVIEQVRQAGYDVAFTLTGGAASYAEVGRHPFAIRRIFLSASDTFPRFTAKLAFGRFLAVS